MVEEMLSGRSLLDYALYAPRNLELHFVFNRACELSDELTRRGFQCSIFKYGIEVARYQRIFSFGRAALSMTRLILQFKPDVLHANNLMAGRIVTLTGKMTSTPSVVQLRNPYVPKRQSWVLDACDKIYCVSEYLKDNIVSNNQSTKSVVVYDGFDMRGFDRTDRVGATAGGPITIGLCSRVSFQKGVHLFCEIAAAYAGNKEINFIHFGGKANNYEQDDYEASLRNRYSDCVEWISYSNSTADFFQSLDIFILPAVEDEAFGRVIVEAMMCGVPCIATRCGGPEEIIIDGETGFLVEADVPSLKKKLDQLIDDPELRKKIGLNAFGISRSQFSISVYTENLIANYPLRSQ